MEEKYKQTVPWAVADEYHTPPDRKRPLVYRIPLIGDIYFMCEMMLRVVWPSRRRALRGESDYFTLVQDSLKTLRCIERTGARVHITGFDRIRQLEGSAVFVGNHMSTLDTFLTPAMFVPFRNACFVAKEALTKGFFGPIHNTYDPVTVGREDPRADLKIVLTDGVERLKGGRSIILFPQRTRSLEFAPAGFNSLGEKLAHRAGVPVVPVAFKTDFFGPGKLIRELGNVRPERDVYIAIGPVLDCAKTGKELHEQVVGFIGNQLRYWGVKVTDNVEKSVSADV